MITTASLQDNTDILTNDVGFSVRAMKVERSTKFTEPCSLLLLWIQDPTLYVEPLFSYFIIMFFMHKSSQQDKPFSDFVNCKRQPLFAIWETIAEIYSHIYILSFVFSFPLSMPEINEQIKSYFYTVRINSPNHTFP